MKRNNKKGFTIVELVIVIAVIAILSAVLIPTFSGIVDKANESAAQQEAKNAHTMYIADIDYAHGKLPVMIYVVTDNGVYSVSTDGKITKTELTLPAADYTEITVNGVDNKVYVVCSHSDAANDGDHACDDCTKADVTTCADADTNYHCDDCNAVLDGHPATGCTVVGCTYGTTE